MKLKALFLTVFASLMVCQAADASVLFQNLLSYDGIEETLEDTSAGVFKDANGVEFANGVNTRDLIRGDVFQGVIQIEKHKPLGGSVTSRSFSGKEIYAAYSLEIVEILDQNGASYTGAVGQIASSLILGAATGVNSLESVLNLSNAGGTNLYTHENISTRVVGGDAAFAVFEYDAALSNQVFDGGDIASTFQQATNSLVMTAGFEAGTDDGYLIRGDALADVTSLSTFFGLSATNTNALKVDGLATVFTDAMGANSEWEGVTNDVLGGASDVSFSGTIGRSISLNNASTFDFGDDVNIVVNPVPEPSTIAIWAAVGLAGAGFVRRRQLKAKKA